MNLAETKKLVDDSYLRRKYRPVAVAIIKDGKERILLVQSAKNQKEWYLPQGGIEHYELVETALFREIKEELGIIQDDLTLIGYLGFEDLDAEKSRKDKRGFTKGKRYFFCTLLSVLSTEVLNFNRDEICGYQWMLIEDIPHIFATSRPEKRELLLRWLNKS